MKNKYCIYIHLRLDTNEVFYVGIGGKRRPYSKHARNRYWKSIVNLVGYKVEILSDNLSWENAQQAEIELIKIYGRKDLKEGILSNQTDGGEGKVGVICSDETKSKIGAGNTGKQRTEEWRINHSDFMKGKTFSLGYKHNEEFCKKASQNTKGDNNPFFGKTHTDKTKKTIADKQSKVVLDENTGVFYNSVKELSEITGIKQHILYDRLSGKLINNTQYKYV